MHLVPLVSVPTYLCVVYLHYSLGTRSLPVFSTFPQQILSVRGDCTDANCNATFFTLRSRAICQMSPGKLLSRIGTNSTR